MEHAQIGDDKCIGLHIIQCSGDGGELFVLCGEGVDIERYITFPSVFVQVHQRFGGFVKSKVACKAAERPELCAEIEKAGFGQIRVILELKEQAATLISALKP